MDLPTILLAVKLLVSTETTPGCREGLVERLQANVESLKAHLRQPEFAELGQKLNHLRYAYSISQASVEGVQATYFEFTVEALCLLITLDEALKFLEKQDIASQSSTEGESKNPMHPTPKALLGASDLKLVQSLVQFIVSLGIYPYLIPGVDTLLELRLSHAKSVAKSQRTLYTEKSWHLFACCQVLVQCAENLVLGPTVLSRHLSDILASLIQVCYGPMDRCIGSDSASNKPSNTMSGTHVLPATPGDVVMEKESNGSDVGHSPRAITAVERERCVEALQQLLDRVYQPLVIRELLTLQGMPSADSTRPPQAQKRDGSRGKLGTTEGGTKVSGSGRIKSPRWLQKACGQLLSACLMKKNGVQHVLRGIFEATSVTGPGGRLIEGGKVGGEESADDWRKCQAVARIIASCPAQAASVEEYYSLVCPQVLALLHLPKEGVGRQFLRVAVATISTMMSSQKLLANKYIVEPLIWPLNQLCGGNRVLRGGDVGNSLLICVEDLHKICAVVEPSSSFVSALLPYLPVLFEVWRVLYSAGAPSSSHTREVLVRLLKMLDTVTVLAFLKFMACMLTEHECEAGFKPMSAGIALQYRGDSLTWEHLGEEGRLELYNTERMESVANCVVTLVESDLKSDQILGLFFTECLQHIAEVLCKSAGYNASDTPFSSKIEGAQLSPKHQTHDSSNSTLLELEQVLEVPTHTEAYSHALVLYITAALCERMSNEVFQQSQLQQLIGVMSVIINCHARFISEPCQKSDKLLVAAEPNLDKLLGGSITLSIVFGLLSAILGGAREVERKDRPLLSATLPALETIASKYPDQELCSLSNDLKICIATLGAVWTAEIKERAAAVGGSLARRAKTAATESVTETKPGRSPTKLSHPAKQGGLHKVSKFDTNLHLSKEHHPVNVPPSSPDLDTDSPLCHALSDLRDPLVPVQGHGLIALTKLIENRDPETISDFSMLLTIFRENLKHSDSYIYLAAINGLVALASAMPREVIPTLCQEYALLQAPPSNGDPTNFDKETGQLRTRPAEVVQGRKPVHSRNSELRMKLGETLVKAVRDCGDTLPQYSDAILAAILSNVCDSDPMIRASSLSNLADVCSLLRFSFSQIQNEVLSCITHILQTDKEPKVRQAALVVLKLLIKGLSQDSIQVLGGSLLEVYRLLKQVEGRERDELTQAHAQAALGELDTIMRGLLFPQPTLTKKISVLDQL